MRRWHRQIGHLFRRGTPAAATVLPAAPAAPLPDMPAEDLYAAFERDIRPLLQTLKNLPPDDSGREFFMRTDVVTPDMVSDEKETRIDVWLFYTRETRPNGQRGAPPNSHLISLESKTSTPERPDYCQLLEIGTAPVLRLSLRPLGSGDGHLTSHHYFERYEKPQTGRKYSIYCGDYGMVLDESVKTPHKRTQDMIAPLRDWLQQYAPSGLAALAPLLHPPRDITLPPAVTVRKRTPPSSRNP